MAIFSNFSTTRAILGFQLLLNCTLIITVVSADNVLENNRIYKIENKADRGVLTVNSSADSFGEINLQTWEDTGDQKWRAKQPKLERILYGKLSYEFIPTSNEDFTLEADSITLKIVGSVMGNNKYWDIIDVGEGAKEIKNYELESCIGSQGLDMPVILVVCDNSEPTRWTFTEL